MCKTAMKQKFCQLNTLFNFESFFLQDRLKSQEDLITSFSSKIEELQVRDKKREIALEAANSLLDKELTRVSTFVEDKVRQTIAG